MVVTAGAWARDLLASIDIVLPVHITRETVSYFAAPPGAAIPSVVDWTGDPPFFSLWDPTTNGLKAGWHHAGVAIEDPDVPGEVEPRIVDGLSAWVAARFPGVNPESIGAETCLYTTTADERFIFERHGRVVVGSPCSGHGFKFAPLSGKRIAALAEEAL